MRPFPPVALCTADPAHSHITEAAVAAHIATAAAGSPPVDVLVRTSGVRRLSDFLTWQVRPRAPSRGADADADTPDM